jgi:acyl carrier protein
LVAARYLQVHHAFPDARRIDEMQTTDFAAIESALQRHLVTLATSRGKASDISRTDALIERGVFDSLSLLDFVVFTEKLCGVRIPGEDVHPENFGSLDAIRRYLRERM